MKWLRSCRLALRPRCRHPEQEYSRLKYCKDIQAPRSGKFAGMKSIFPPRETIRTSLPVAAITAGGEHRAISAIPAAELPLNCFAGALKGKLVAERLEVGPCLARRAHRAPQRLTPLRTRGLIAPSSRGRERSSVRCPLPPQEWRSCLDQQRNSHQAVTTELDDQTMA